MHRRFKNPYRFSLLLPVVSIAIIGSSLYFGIAYEPDWTYDWEGIRTEIRDSTRLVAERDFISNGVVGNSGRTPLQFYRRKWIMKNATIEVLSRLTKYPNGTVKAMAYEGLIRSSDGLEFELVMSALNERSDLVYYMSGCEEETMLIGEYLVNTLFRDELKIPGPLPPPRSNIYEFSPEEKRELKEVYTDLMREKQELIIDIIY